MIPDVPRHDAGRAAPAWRTHTGLLVLGGMSAFAVLLLVLSVFGDQGFFRIRRLSRDKALLEEKVAGAEQDAGALRRRLTDLREGRASSELAAREKLGLVKPGEVVYDFRGDPLRPDAAAAAGGR
ncbi:MAG TPA: septum formation initiator family protein [bacterium]